MAADSAYLSSILATLGGPLVLVGHSYGGCVITNAATGNANVTALVYVAAFAPDQGETVQELQTRFPGTGLVEIALDFRPHDAGVDAYIKKEPFHDVFAGDVPRTTTDPLAQRAGARTVEVDASHVVMIAQPGATADLIRRAAR